MKGVDCCGFVVIRLPSAKHRGLVVPGKEEVEIHGSIMWLPQARNTRGRLPGYQPHVNLHTFLLINLSDVTCQNALHSVHQPLCLIYANKCSSSAPVLLVQSTAAAGLLFQHAGVYLSTLPSTSHLMATSLFGAISILAPIAQFHIATTFVSGRHN
jgi:hypothetical protein